MLNLAAAAVAAEVTQSASWNWANPPGLSRSGRAELKNSGPAELARMAKMICRRSTYQLRDVARRQTKSPAT